MDTRTLAPGHEIHWYRIESVLGQGGFGITYLAHDTNLDRPVAIKEYLPASMAARHADDSVRPLTEGKRDDFAWGLGAFLSEARTLARFRHENIVGVHSVFEANSTAYMVMAYEQGDSLAALFRQGRCRDQASLERIFFPIFDGLVEIHRLGFLHRDIKPGNVYIRENGTAVLIDFGSARSMNQQQTGEMTALVSQGYTPLEQYSANYGEQGPWTDVYALAATLHEGISGVKPEEALSRSACLLRRRPDPVTPLVPAAHAGFDAAFLDAVSAGLALQPEERPADLDAWRAVFAGAAHAAPAFPVDEATRLRPDPDEVTRIRAQAVPASVPPPSSPADEDDRTRLQPASGRVPADDWFDGGTPVGAVGSAGGAAADDASGADGVSGAGGADAGRHPSPATGRPAERLDRDSPAESAAGSAALDLFGTDDLDPPTYRAAPDAARAAKRERASGSGGGKAFGAIAATLLVAALGGGAWWLLGSGAAPDADGGASGESVAAVALDPALVDTLPAPARALDVDARDADVSRRLEALGELAAVYGRAGAAGASGESFESGARAVRAELGEHALDWHPVRHAAIVGRIERAVALLPESVADRVELQATIAAADERSDLAAARELLARRAIVNPAGEALIDRIGRLREADYRALVASPDWTRMMGTLGSGALERVRAADFDGASMLVRAALTLQPDEPFMRRLGAHLESGTGS